MPFKNIIGQDTAIHSIKNIISKGYVKGSYLFMGPDGVGKRSTAIELAKAINCESGGMDSCDECVSCKKIDGLNHPDVSVKYPEGASLSIKIADIRDIIYQASLKPYEAKKRVFIINDAECMTEEAQNALLKLLEESPENHILILTASNAAGLLPTVRSRCRILKFGFLARDIIKGILVAKNIAPEHADIFSHMAMGSIGKAIEFKEKDIIAHRDRVLNDFFLRKTAVMKEQTLIDYNNRELLERSLNILLCWYRDLLVSKFIDTEEILFNIDRSREIFSYRDGFSIETLEKDIMKIMKTMQYIENNVNPKLALFNMAIEMRRN